MKTIFMSLAMLLSFSFAHAQGDYTQQITDQDSVDMASPLAGPLWTCSLDFKGNASGLKIIIGTYQFYATGKLSCLNINGSKVNYPVSLVMKSALISPAVAIGKYEMTGKSVNISLFHSNPSVLLGGYLVAQGHGAVIAGAGIITAAKVGMPQLTLDISLQFVKGFGVDLAFNKLTISRMK